MYSEFSHTSKNFEGGLPKNILEKTHCFLKKRCRNMGVWRYRVPRSVCPRVGIGTPPPPLPHASVPLPPGTKEGGGTQSPAGEGVGESQFQRPGVKAWHSVYSVVLTLCETFTVMNIVRRISEVWRDFLFHADLCTTLGKKGANFTKFSQNKIRELKFAAYFPSKRTLIFVFSNSGKKATIFINFIYGQFWAQYIQ
jgi:hypothetical protein